jgi:hypothetical protein
MHKTLFAILLFCSVQYSNAQQKITLQEVSKHIGDSVTVCGKIFGGKFVDASYNKPTFLNMGAAYPDQLLTIVIWGSARKLFPYKPEEKLKNKMVCITGKIELFKNKPQIVLQQPDQLQEQ